MVISGADATVGLPTAMGVVAEKDEMPFAVLIVLAFNAVVSRGTIAGLLPKVTFRSELVSHTHVLPSPSPVSTSTSPQENLPKILPWSDSWLKETSSPLPCDVKRADEMDGERQKVKSVKEKMLASLASAILILCRLCPASKEHERHLGIVAVMYVRDPVSLCVEFTAAISFAEDEPMVTSS